MIMKLCFGTGALSRSSIIGEAAKGRIRWSREDQELYVCLACLYTSSCDLCASLKQKLLNRFSPRIALDGGYRFSLR